jgi:hypothetical protein
LGVIRFDVNAANYDPEGGKLLTRPDTSAALKRAHAAAVHDKWFRAEVEQALQEADDPATEWIPHAVVKADMAKQRAELKARIAKTK